MPEVGGRDTVEVAPAEVEGASGVMVGDSAHDIQSAGKVDIVTIALRTGGFGTDELLGAGALMLYDSLVELREHLGETPPGRPRS